MLEADVEVDRREFTVRADLRVAPGERLALFGPSGAGKTTLLEAIAGLVALRRGRVALAGRVLTSTQRPVRAVPPWQRRVGLLRQDPGLFPHLSVRQNLAYAPAADATAREFARLAEVLGLSALLPAMPARLSGGQAHRVALGRLLLSRCDALLLDEPYTGLDASLRRTLTGLVVALVTERELPAVLVAHELADAQAFADRLAIIDHGVLLQDGAPDEVVLRPASRRVAELIGYLGFVPVLPAGPGARPPSAGTADAAGAGAVAAAVPGGGPGDGIVAGVHPERVIYGAHPNRGIVLTGTIRGGRPAGATWETDLLIGTAQITCRLADRPAAQAGELVVTVIEPPCFGPDGLAVAAREAGQDPAWPRQVSA